MTPNLRTLIDEAKRLSEATTPGPWEFGYICIDDPMQKNFANRWQLVSQHMCFGTEAAKRDAAFIAFSRSALPKLASECERLSQQVAIAKAAFKEIIGNYGRGLHANTVAHRTLEALDDAAKPGGEG